MLGNGQTVTTANERSKRPNDDDPYECEHKRGFGAKVSSLDGVNIIRGPFGIRALKNKNEMVNHAKSLYYTNLPKTVILPQIWMANFEMIPTNLT